MTRRPSSSSGRPSSDAGRRSSSSGGGQKRVIVVNLEAGSPDAQQFSRALRDIPGIDLRFVRGTNALELAPSAEIVATSQLPDAFLRAAQKLRWVSFFSAGVDGKMKPPLVDRQLLVTSAVGVHGPNVAEHVLGFMLTFTHGLHHHLRDQDAHRWRDWEGSRAQGSELMGQTLVIVGLGHIGSALAERARAFGMRIAAVKRDPRRMPETLPDGVVDGIYGIDQLDAVLGAAHHVAICAPLTANTTHLFDRKRFDKMKRGSYLYNIARGGLVDTAALIEALGTGRLAGAGLDVFEEEPLPATSPLWALPNVLITPHDAGLTPRYFERTANLFAANLKRYISGEPLAQQYDPTRGY